VDLKEIDWKLVVAAYAAVVSTLIAFWQVYLGFRDRSRLKVSAHYGKSHPADVGLNSPEEEFVVIGVVNDGRRPVTVVSAGIGLSDGREIIVEGTMFPLELSESKSGDFAVNMKLISSQPITAWVRDSRNKLYRSRRDVIRRPRKAI
jgi:hypothetical protein